MDRMSRRRPDPILMGEPSPSLAKINRMNMQQLAERIKALETESAHLSAKIERLSQVEPRDDEKIAALTEQKARLAALADVARKRLSGKAERTEQGSGRGSRSGRYPRHPRR